MEKIVIRTQQHIQVLDITDEVQKALGQNASKAALVFCPHTTCALVLNESEPDLAADFEALIKQYYGQTWKHDAHDGNAAAHLASSVFGHAVTVPIEDGRLQLGTWQRILLLEGDGPRERNVWIRTL